MKTVTDSRPKVRTIVENVRLDACAASDRVDIRHVAKGRFGSIGSIRLEKIKAIPGGKVQIKYQAGYGRVRKILKADLPADLIVERRRDATAADGPDAGVPEIRTATHEGVPYRAIDPDGDVDELLLAAVQTGMGEGRTITEGVRFMSMVAERVQRGPKQFGPATEGVHPSFRPGPAGAGKSLVLQQRAAAVAAAALMGGGHGDREPRDARDPEMERMGQWLGAFEDRGILRPGAKEKLMGSIWSDGELRDGRPKPGSVVVDG